MTGRHSHLHWSMLVAGTRRRDYREVLGQVPRMLALALLVAFAELPLAACDQ